MTTTGYIHPAYTDQAGQCRIYASSELGDLSAADGWHHLYLRRTHLRQRNRPHGPLDILIWILIASMWITVLIQGSI